MLFERYEKNPILGPEPRNAWESIIRTNPGVCFDPASNKYVMLYRASGNDPEHVIHLGLAWSDNGYDFTPASDQPVFSPSKDGFDSGCIEDPRLFKYEDWFVFTYAARAFPPGQYWKEKHEKSYDWPIWPDFFPYATGKNQTSTGLALTQDFKTFIRCGRLTDPMMDDRDVILFPEKVKDDWWLMHRPLDWAGSGYENPHPAIYINHSKDLLDWKLTNSRLLAKAEFNWETKIGANNPPVKTEAGWLIIYHGVAPDQHYRLGALLCDLDDPAKVTHRTREPLFEPEEDYEMNGYYKAGGVVFPCGNVVIDNRFVIYYGCADKYVGVASCDYRRLMETLLAQPWQG